MDVEGCPTCHHRSVQLSPAATPTKTKKFAPLGPKGNNSWERGILTDKRRDGTEMPILKPDGNLIHTKEAAEQRSTIEAGRRQIANE